MGAHDRNIIDGRTLPFFTITTLETDILGERFTGRRLPVARSIYFAMVELANEARATAFEKPRKAIASKAGVNVRVIDEYAPDLEAAGLIEVERIQIEGVWHVSRWVIRGGQGGDPASPPPSDRGRTTPSDPAPPLNQEGDQEPSEPPAPRAARPARAREGPEPVHVPSELGAAFAEVVTILDRIAEARGVERPSRESLARAMIRRVDREPDMARTAEALEHWACHGNGRRRQVKDVLARWRDWLDRDGPTQQRGSTPLALVGGGRRPTAEDERQARQRARLERIAAARAAEAS